MKYIRTKDGRILENKVIINPRVVQFYSDEEIENGISPNQVVKQADTIEELCDEFVLINSKIWVLGGYNQFESKKDAEWDYKNAVRLWKISKVPNKALYGAIWTDRGLIYVAKMNDKGELELL